MISGPASSCHIIRRGLREASLGAPGRQQQQSKEKKLELVGVVALDGLLFEPTILSAISLLVMILLDAIDR